MVTLWSLISSSVLVPPLLWSRPGTPPAVIRGLTASMILHQLLLPLMIKLTYLISYTETGKHLGIQVNLANNSPFCLKLEINLPSSGTALVILAGDYEIKKHFPM